MHIILGRMKNMAQKFLKIRLSWKHSPHRVQNMSVHSDDSLFVLILLFNSIMAPQYDAIIVGAGPAGLSAGITLAKNGKSVLVFDKQVRGTIFPRGEKIHRLPFVE